MMFAEFRVLPNATEQTTVQVIPAIRGICAMAQAFVIWTMELSVAARTVLVFLVALVNAQVLLYATQTSIIVREFVIVLVMPVGIAVFVWEDFALGKDVLQEPIKAAAIVEVRLVNQTVLGEAAREREYAILASPPTIQIVPVLLTSV
jgi:hypothetical protein